MPTIGMTGHAQELLGGLVFVELPGRKPSPSNRSRPLPMYMRRWSKPIPPLSIHRNASAGMRKPIWLFRLKPDNDADVDAQLDAAAYASPADA